MSFLERAKQAAAQAAEQASGAAQRASSSLSDPATADRARKALGRARRGVATAIDRIDPGVLADVVIKATALQERANASLRAKKSPYRISQVQIGAAIPPSIVFTINRIDAWEETLVESTTSTDLEASAGTDDAVRALDGSEIDPDAPEPGAPD